MHGHSFDARFHRARHAWGGRMGQHAERHARRRFGRFFEHGDLRFVVLALLEEQPRHGYELMKELEERTGGAYRPSPGVVYPTLAMLEDEGLIRPAETPDGGRKLYEITDTGRSEIERNRPLVDAALGRMDEVSRQAGPGRPRVARAMRNLGMALRARMARDLTPEQLDRIVAMIDDTAAAVERT